MNLCPACTNALSPTCPEPACRKANADADAALDLLIEASDES